MLSITNLRLDHYKVLVYYIQNQDQNTVRDQPYNVDFIYFNISPGHVAYPEVIFSKFSPHIKFFRYVGT